MSGLFTRIGFLSALIAVLSVSELRAGYLPYVYHRHDHFHYHYFGALPVWYHAYPPYAFDYGYSVRPGFFKKRRAVRRGRSLPANWYYCRSFWRIEDNMIANRGRFWWPYFNPRPVTPDPCNYKNDIRKAPGFRPY
jgi:hypothetical protein